MPIYEFYCPDCNTIFNFLARNPNTTARPSCPKCSRPDLDKQVSRFATVGSEKNGDDDDGMPVSDARMESAMAQLAGEAENMNENDPRQEADLMRKFSKLTGINYGAAMDEAIGRLEAGEDMEDIERDMGDALESEDLPFVMPDSGTGRSSRQSAPRHDENLYEM